MKRLPILFAILVAALLGTALNAQTGTIQGTVLAADGSPMEAANVSVEGTTLGGVTNQVGEYEIKNITTGRYQLVISSVGYESQAVTVRVVANEVTTVAPVIIQLKGEELSEVLVRGDMSRYVEEKVSTSLRLPTPIAKVPQNIQVISSELLQDQLSTTIMDGVIRNVSGVTMLEHWGHFARVHMRGFRIPAFRNGFNVSDSWGPLAEDMAFTDQIEFIKGPSAFMITAGEPGGIYNVVTKGATAQPIREITLMGGSFDFLRASVDIGGQISADGKLLYRFNGLYQTTDTHRGNEQTPRYGMSQAFTYRFSDRTSLSLDWNYQEARQFIGAAYAFTTPGGELGTLPRDFNFVDSNFPASNISENMLYTRFNHSLSDRWNLTAQVGRLVYDQIGNSAWVSFIAPQAVLDNGDAFRSISIWDAKSKGNYAQVFVDGKANTGSISHTILTGIDYTDKEYFADFYQSFQDTVPFNVNNPDYGRNLNGLGFDRFLPVDERQPDPYNGFNSTAFYFQDELGFIEDRLRVTLAGRFTMIETIDLFGGNVENEKFTPRVGISFDIMDDLTVYGLFDQSFLAQNGIKEGGEALDPVTATDLEGGIKKQFLDGRVSATLGAFVITKNDLALPVAGQQFSVQTGEVQSRGVEFDLQGEILPGLNAVVNYAATNVEITEDENPENVGNRLSGHARHMTNAWLSYSFSQLSFAKGFGVSLGYQYQINRSTWGLGADGEPELPDYFRLDGGVFWQKDKIRVQLNVNNITDEYLFSGSAAFGTPYWQTEPGINGRLAVTYNFR